MLLKNVRVFVLSLLSIGVTTGIAFADNYVIDTAHSRMGFSVTHLTVSEVQGEFKAFEGQVALDKDTQANSKFSATIQVNSIDTRNEGRDGHLKQADFFDAEKFPTITFDSTKVDVQGNVYSVTGDLTIKGVTKSLTIPLTISGPVKNPMNGIETIGFSGKAVINRKDFGVSWNKQMDQGGMVVGDDVTLQINLELKKQ